MKTTQLNTTNAYKRVLIFLNANAAQLGSVMQLAAVAVLTALVASLTGGGGTQGSTVTTKGGNTNQIKTMRAALIKTMRSIAAIAKAARPTTPNIPTPQPPPLNISSAKLLEDATAMVQAVTPFQQTFIAAGLAATFVADLSSAIAELDSAVTAQGTFKGQRVNATTVVATSLKAARAQFDIIAPQVENALVGNEPLLQEWKTIKRVSPRPSSASSSTSTPVTPTPTPTPAATPTHPAGTAPAAGADHAHTPEAIAA